MNIFQRQSFGGVLHGSCSYNFKKLTAKNLCLWPATLFKKRLCYRGFECCGTFKDTFFNRTPPAVASGLFFSADLSFLLYQNDRALRMLPNYFLHRLIFWISKIYSKSSCPAVLYKKVVPRDFTKSTGKHLCQSLFFSKITAFRPINSIIKQYCSCCDILIRIDTNLSKNIQNNFQNLLFKKLLAQSGGQTDIFWKFYSPADTLWLPKTVGRVLGYTTDKFIRLYIGHTGDQL